MTSATAQLDVVTGAFSYSGAAIARELRAAGHRVRTVTGHPGRAPAGARSGCAVSVRTRWPAARSSRAIAAPE